jgi:hypothetical protein
MGTSGHTRGGSSAEAVAPVCGTGTRGFESRLSPQEIWLAGLLEGEGSFMISSNGSRSPRVRISVEMADFDVIHRVADMWGVAIAHLKPQKPEHKPTYRVAVGGGKAMQIMTTLRPLMGQRRQAQIDLLIQLRQEHPPKRQRRVSEADAQSLVREFRAGAKAPALAEKYGIRRESVYRIMRVVDGGTSSGL